MARRKYDREFKQEAARLVLDEGRSIRSVEDALGITQGVLKDWVRQYRKHDTEAFVGSGNQTPEAAELKRLRKEVAELRMERDILKKATAYFSRDALNDSRS